MYEAFFGLRERPFDLATNPRFIFLTPRHREALSTLRYGISSPRGLTLLLGDAGTGKTTLVRAALCEESRPENRTLLLSNPTLTRPEFYEFIARGFGLSESAADSKAQFLHEFQQEVQARHDASGLTTLIIDEAQSLPDELLEEVRLLANIETATAKLLNLVLVGQPELADRLNQPSLRQLKQRITLRWQLTPLDLRETAVYIASRIRVAGGNAGQIFTREAVAGIFDASHGLPRIINVICDNALLGGYAAQIKPIDQEIVREICRDFDLEPAPLLDEATAAAHLPAGGNGNVRTGRGSGQLGSTGDNTGSGSAERDERGLRVPALGETSKKRKFFFFFF